MSADCKSAGTPSGVASHPCAWRGCVSSARRSGGVAIRRQKRLDLFIADLQSAAVGFSCLLWAFSLEADCKSALNRSSLFCLRIANPQGRLAGLRLTLAPGGVASLPFAWRGCVSPFRLAGLRLFLAPGGGWVSLFTPCQPGVIPTAGGGSCD